MMVRCGPTEVEPLPEVNALIAKEIRRVLVLDAFSDRLEPEGACQTDDGPDDMEVGRTLGQVANELDVDLQEADRELLEVGESPEPRAEVVESEPAAETGHAAGEGFRGFHVLDERGFGDLEDHVGRIGTGPPQLSFDERKEIQRTDRHGGEVRLHPPPGRGDPDRFGDDPAVDLADESVSLGGGQEGSGQDDLAGCSDHPQEELLLRFAASEGKDRLRIQRQPVLIEGIPDPPHPAELGQLPSRRRLLLLLVGGIAEHDHLALDVLPDAERRG